MSAARIGPILDRLLRSDEPSIRWKTRVHMLGEDRDTKKIRALEDEVRGSARVRKLLEPMRPRPHIYQKWQGWHWVLASLGDIGYPRGDERLHPLRDAVLDVWLGPSYFREFEARTESAAYAKKSGGVPKVRGRYRRCGSQQGNALWSILALGIDDGRADQLAERLTHWQWPDGGWNCDRHPEADTSSFNETLLPMQGLFVYGRERRSRKATAAAKRASDVFLSRRMYKRRSNGRVMREDFATLHYPLYWHYDFLGGLKAMARMGLVGDPRCADALDLLESKRLPDGGWPAERAYYAKTPRPRVQTDHVTWGGTSAKRMNEWVTVDALAVLVAAGRMRV